MVMGLNWLSALIINSQLNSAHLALSSSDVQHKCSVSIYLKTPTLMHIVLIIKMQNEATGTEVYWSEYRNITLHSKKKGTVNCE